MYNLYVMSGCPYCKKVINYMDENGIAYHKFDISDSDNYNRLMELGGIEQVPFLHDEDKDVKMYESSDIIEYIKSTKV